MEALCSGLGVEAELEADARAERVGEDSVASVAVGRGGLASLQCSTR